MNIKKRIQQRASFYLILTILWIMSANCPGPDIGTTLNRRIKNPMTESQSIKVFFATNRKTNGSFPECTADYYTTKFSDKISYGSCDVNVPAGHPIGTVDVERNSPEKDLFFSMGNYDELNESSFFNKVGATDDILLFIHGFNVKYDEAVYRAAQIAYDIKFQGNVVLYTWPAGPDNALGNFLMNLTYEENRKNAKDTVDLLVPFFEKFSKNKKKNIYLVVHSMGHQVAVPALFKYSVNGGEKFFKEIVFNAPDIDISELRAMIPSLMGISKRITMYCSPNDNALLVSKKMNNNFRAGLCGSMHGVDVINVHEVDSPIMGVGGLGHGYYAGRAIIADLMQLILGMDVEKRIFIRTSKNPQNENYVLRR